MKEKQNLVITIGRQYGSGGRIVGKALAEELGIHFYDDGNSDHDIGAECSRRGVFPFGRCKGGQ